MRLVEQYPHQLGTVIARMRIVELDGDLFGQRVPVGIGANEIAGSIGIEQREKVLLHDRSAAPRRGVVGVENPGEDLAASVPPARSRTAHD